MFPIQIKVLEKKPPDVTVRAWSSIRRDTMQVLGDYWYANMLPERFKPNAGARFGFRRRTKYYLRAKQLKTHYNRVRLSPMAKTMSLVKSGTLYIAMTARGRVIRAFPSRFTVTMPGLVYTPRKNRNPEQPFIQGELTYLLRSEIKVLQKLGKQTALERIEKYRANRSTVAQ